MHALPDQFRPCPSIHACQILMAVVQPAATGTDLALLAAFARAAKPLQTSGRQSWLWHGVPRGPSLISLRRKGMISPPSYKSINWQWLTSISSLTHLPTTTYNSLLGG